ncbi:hypothetical protein EV645_2756 [Kribbella rubisoli]|uniref:Uncharacterized protein n=1 Tax=Kribbella rubisoli TaxID=3075929 RepID=A0A4Q7XBM0_9ACTN|nr:hypothetical protein EV645_2756 [Kribbella rubisoli]
MPLAWGWSVRQRPTSPRAQEGETFRVYAPRLPYVE